MTPLFVPADKPGRFTKAAASEAAYEKLTAELKARVVEMWEGLRTGEQEEPSASTTHQ